jgi:hypothetical protein
MPTRLWNLKALMLTPFSVNQMAASQGRTSFMPWKNVEDVIHEYFLQAEHLTTLVPDLRITALFPQ